MLRYDPLLQTCYIDSNAALLLVGQALRRIGAFQPLPSARATRFRRGAWKFDIVWEKLFVLTQK